MTEQEPKDARIEIRISKSQKELLKKRAEAADMTLTEYILFRLF